MQTKPEHTVVVLPDNQKLEVSYYCNDLEGKENKKTVDLVIQLDDCHSSVKVSKQKMKQRKALEKVVQKTVINAKGHLCD